MTTKYERELYDKVDAAWPNSLPPLSEGEAKRATGRLYRFILGRRFMGKVKITSGNRFGGSHIEGGKLVLVVNPSMGWDHVVHMLSHRFCRELIGEGHGEGHALLEKRMVEHVVAKGWLDGRLKDREKQKPNYRLLRAERIRKRLLLWERKAKRANNAVKKLRGQILYYQELGILT